MDFFNNPEFLRLLRSKLRSKMMISYGIAAFLVYAGALTLAYFAEKQSATFFTGKMNVNKLFRTFFFVTVGIQLALVSMYAVALAAQNLTLEKERGTYDFQRLVAMGPWRLTVGKVMGAPIEAFFMGMLGLPFALVSCLACDIPISVFVQSQIVIAVYGILTSCFGVMCSSLVEKTAQATGIVALMGVPILIAHSVVSAPSLWATSSPIFMFREFASANYSLMNGSVWLGIPVIDGNMAYTGNFKMGIPVPFILGFLLSNGLLLLLGVTITARRIADAELSFLTPRQGLIAFFILQVYLMMNVLTSSSLVSLNVLVVFHSANLLALVLLAFGLTPGAELVRGRVARAVRDQHWNVVLERTNRLQDSPGLRAMLDVCAMYILSSLALTAFLLKFTPDVSTLYNSVLLMFMIASIGIALSGLLLYIQVYTETGAFKLGAALLSLALILPPVFLWILTVTFDRIPPSLINRISPVAYIANLEELNRGQNEGLEIACPLICVVLAVAFVVLSGMRVRFLLDVADIVRKKALAKK